MYILFPVWYIKFNAVFKMTILQCNFQNLVINLSTLSHSFDFLAPLLLFFLYSYHWILKCKEHCSSFSKKIPHNLYKLEMTILLLKPMGCNYSEDAPSSGFPNLHHFVWSNCKTKWTQKLDSLCRSNKIFILKILLFFYILRHSFGVFKTFTFGTP